MQPAYQHLIVTHRLLSLSGDRLRQEIRALKESGLKTEPAIAKILGLSGDPYVELVKLRDKTDVELQKLLDRVFN